MIEVKEHTIFDHLHNVFVSKFNNMVKKSDSFPFYMMQRWGSMHSTNMALLLNEHVNPRYRAMLDSKMEYDYLKTVTPKLKTSKFKYYKKQEKEKLAKKANEFSDEDIGIICKQLELSRQDVSLMISSIPEELKKIINNTVVLKGKKIK